MQRRHLLSIAAVCGAAALSWPSAPGRNRALPAIVDRMHASLRARRSFSPSGCRTYTAVVFPLALTHGGEWTRPVDASCREARRGLRVPPRKSAPETQVANSNLALAA